MDPAAAYEASVIARNEEVFKLAERGGSEIQNFYSDAVIFITGGSGFLGKQLIEKTFRSCRNIKKVYLLLRPKKGISGQERLSQLLKEPVYDNLYKSYPTFMEKIEVIEGDIEEIKLGMSQDNWEKIIETVHIIFNVAATVSFNQPIKTATLTNIRGTREILTLAKACKILRSLVHVSTAYSHATSINIKGKVSEQFYPSPIDPGALIRMAETMEDSRLDDITPQLIKNWPNTYAFTKAVAEELVRKMGEDIPVCIVRPVIVFGSYLEPTPGWVDVQTSLTGPPGVTLAPCSGLVHVMLADTKTKTDLVPVDMVNNALFAAGWETANRWINGDKDTKIYTISGTQNRISYGDIRSVLECETRRFISPTCIWYPFAITVNNIHIFKLLCWILHYIPAYIIDFFLKLHKKSLISLVKVYTKFTKISEVLQYFLTCDWLFANTNTKALFQKMSSDDQIIYNFDMTKVNCRELVNIWYIGQRRYVLKDGLKDTEKAVSRQKWFKLLNCIVLCIYAYVMFKLCVFIFSLICWCF